MKNGKGDQRRPRFVSRELYDLNYDLAHGNISKSTYYRRKRRLVPRREVAVRIMPAYLDEKLQ